MVLLISIYLGGLALLLVAIGAYLGKDFDADNDMIFLFVASIWPLTVPLGIVIGSCALLIKLGQRLAALSDPRVEPRK